MSLSLGPYLLGKSIEWKPPACLPWWDVLAIVPTC